MIRNRTKSYTLLAAIAVLAVSAQAHIGHEHVATNGFTAGMLHPLTGLDHILAMVAVGLWSTRFEGRLRWALPACFVGVMALGALLGMANVGLPFVEPAIAASVVVLGILVASAAPLPAAPSVALVALFALFHGHAHGTELVGTSAATFISGFALSTVALHLAGIAAGVGLAKVVERHERAEYLSPIGGSAVAVCGALMLAGVL